ncbi:MAG: hypothetical protein IKW96_06985 [Ruminococcus sp.]|uniref:SH3 domain-containing protein n=1 Tax=Ruminococcus sp. TaxID=41978 RepID=UPI0025D02EF7|nr:hypothetical protein [Ruminococcus sp.]MBR5683008.1 hypothetical protein [Ruminococcus sp.]
MTNIKRRIASFVAAFAMVGAVTVPSVAKYVVNDTAIVAEAAVVAKVATVKCDKWVDIKGNTNFRAEPNTKSKVVASIAKDTKGKPVHLISRTKKKQGNYYWYYSEFDKGWVRSDRIK